MCYRIILNKCSLHVDRHLGKFRGSREKLYRFFSHFPSFLTHFHLFYILSEHAGRVYSRSVYSALCGILIQYHTSACIVEPYNSVFMLHHALYWNQLYYVKCYPGGLKIDLIPSESEILSQTWYHCIQYTKPHHMSLVSFSTWLVHLDVLFILEMLAVQAISRINDIFK